MYFICKSKYGHLNLDYLLSSWQGAYGSVACIGLASCEHVNGKWTMYFNVCRDFLVTAVNTPVEVAATQG